MKTSGLASGAKDHSLICSMGFVPHFYAEAITENWRLITNPQVFHKKAPPLKKVVQLGRINMITISHKGKNLVNKWQKKDFFV